MAIYTHVEEQTHIYVHIWYVRAHLFMCVYIHWLSYPWHKYFRLINYKERKGESDNDFLC